jgi:tetratricopeptide (TPR) repeat protein
VEEHYRELIDLYTQRIEIDPENPAHYRSRAECYIYLGDNKKALADLEKYTETNPSEAAAGYSRVARPLVCRPQEMVNPEIVVELYRKANQIQPDKWEYLWGLGAAYYRAGRWEEAISALTRSTELPGGEDGRNFFFLSLAHWQSGEKTAAANWYKKAIEWMQKSNVDTEQWIGSLIHDLYLEAAELMGMKPKDF